MFDPKNARGSLLFETLISLLVLAIGVTACIHIFGNALYANNRNFEQLQARRYLDNYLFSIFSISGEISAEGLSGEQEIPSKNPGKSLFYRWKLEPLFLAQAQNDDGKLGMKKNYARLRMRIMEKNQNSLFDADTVVSRSPGAA